MRNMTKRTISAALILALILSLFVCSVSAASGKITTTPTGYTQASDVEYVKVGKTVANWGARNEDCVFLSEYALSFYTDSNTYDNLVALSGSKYQNQVPQSELYAALQNLMKSKHTNIQSYQQTRDYYKYTDCVSSDYSKISSFYSGTMVKSAWDGGSTYNREHVWPDSKCIDSGRSSNDSADIMTLRATVPSENGSRGNKAYGESSGYCDPGVSVRGDCARMLLYTYVRWGNDSKMWGSSGVIENLNILLKWMEEDPVDTWEMGRNDAVQSITGTRNVFVDYPELAWILFDKDIPTDMVTPSGEAAGSSSTCTHANTQIRYAQAATCSTEGYTGDTYCTDCGRRVAYGTAISTTAHVDANNDGSCDNCGYLLRCDHLTTEVRNASSATCDRAGYTGDTYCKTCGKKLSSGTVLEPVSHTNENGDNLCDVCGQQILCEHAQTELKNVREATCLEEGYTGDTCCAACGVKLAEGETIEKTDHTETVVDEKKATCVDKGYTGDTVCEICGEVLAKGEEIEATGEHTYGEWRVTKEATETETGKRMRKCTVCGDYDSEEIPVVEAPVQEQPDGISNGVVVAVVIIAGVGAVAAAAVVVVVKKPELLRGVLKKLRKK